MPVTDRSGATPDTGESLHIIDKVSIRMGKFLVLLLCINNG